MLCSLCFAQTHLFVFPSFPNPYCASPISALLFLFITPPFCAVFANPARCAKLFLLLSFLDPLVLSVFRSLFFSWLIESGELLLKIMHSLCLSAKLKFPMQKLRKKLHRSLLRPCSSHKNQVNSPENSVKFT